MNYTRLAIVLPCYNPPDRWADNLIEKVEQIQTQLPKTQLQIVLVNDGSTEGIQPYSIQKIQSKITDFLFLEHAINQGKGATLRKGMSAVEADFYIYTDIDFPYEADSFVEVAQLLLQQKADIVAGEKNQNYYEQVPGFRRMISKVLQWSTKTILRLPTADTQCGLKGFNEKGKAIFLSTTIDRYLFDLEFLRAASKDKNVKVLFVPVQLREGVQFSQVGLGLLLKEGVNFLKLIFS